MPILSTKLLTPVDIVVDSREASKAKDIVSSLKEKGLKIAITSLEAGDYYLLSRDPTKTMLVERKTVIDFANSIRDNRVWDQAKRLKEVAEKEGVKPLIVLEGWLGLIERKTQWNIVSILRILDELILDWNIPILPIHSRKAFVSWLVAKARSLGATNEKRVIRLRVEKKPMDINSRILYVTEGVVGPILARRLLEKFRTLRRIANASISELMDVEGIGEKRAKEIYLLFNTEWRPEA